MLQRIRDEAHRFANTFHRELRGKRMTASSLDGIAGLGEARKKKLVQVMGGVNAVKKASLEELKALSFLPDAVAEAIHAKFHQGTASSPSSTVTRLRLTELAQQAFGLAFLCKVPIAGDDVRRQARRSGLEPLSCPLPGDHLVGG